MNRKNRTKATATQIQNRARCFVGGGSETSPRSLAQFAAKRRGSLSPSISAAETPSASRLGEVGLELRRHLLGEEVGHAEPLPLLPALLDERGHHATSASIGARTESTSPRTSRHARTPSASARRPLGEAR